MSSPAFRGSRPLALLVLMAAAAAGAEEAAPPARRRFDGPAVAARRVPLARRVTTTWAEMQAWDRAFPRVVEKEREENEPRLPVPDLPVPDEILLRAGSDRAEGERRAAALSDVAAPQAPSPAASASFQGFLDNINAIPPDTNGAVGPGALVSMLNPRVVVQTKGGGTQSSVSLNAFWSSVGGGSGAFDSRVFYDRIGGRFIAVAIDESFSASNGILIGASTSSDPLGGWQLFKYDFDASNAVWADFPSIGYNANWVVVTVNAFPVGGGNLQRHEVWAFGRANLEAGIPGTAARFALTGSGNTMVPASGNVSTMYLVNTWNSFSGVLRLHTITGGVGSESFATRGFITLSGGWNPEGDEIGLQLGSGQKIDLGDDRMLSAQYASGNRVWIAHTAFLPTGTANHALAQWAQLNVADPSNPSVVQQGRIQDGSGAVSYAYPSLAVNDSGDMLIGYSRFSASQYASANYSFRFAADGLGTLRDDTVLKSGEASYFKTYSGTRNRWGDYSATAVDPSDGKALWTLQEYAATPGGGFDRWATWWGKVTANRLTPTGPAAVTEGDSGTKSAVFTVTLSPSAASSVTVSYTTVDGTATAGNDYVSTSGSLTFTAGQTSKTVSVPVIGDLQHEAATESFGFQLSNASGGVIVEGPASATILDNDPVPNVSVISQARAEGDATNTWPIEVSLDRESDLDCTVHYATTNGTATAGSDYTAASGNLTIGAGTLAKNVTLTILGETVRENDEALTLTLSAPSGCALGVSSATLTIVDDDNPRLTVDSPSIVEGDSGTATLTFTITQDRTDASDVTVSWATVNGTAAAGSDYTAASGTATIAATTTSTTVGVTITGERTTEPNETLLLVLSAPVGALLGTPSTGTGTIVNDDPLPVLTIDSPTLTEGDAGTQPLAFTVTMDRPSSVNVLVGFATVPGTASAGADYTAALSNLIIPAGDTTGTISISVAGETTTEADESFAVVLSSPFAATLGTPATGTGTITNDDPPPQLTIDSPSVSEGDAGTRFLLFTVAMDRKSAFPVSVAFAATDGTATTTDGDYTTAGGTLDIAPGAQSGTIGVPILGDLTPEEGETLTVTLSSPSNASLGVPFQGTGTIRNDDPLLLAISDVTVREGHAGTRDAVFRVTLNAPWTQTVTVHWATADRTARAGGADYGAASGTLTFAPGETVQTITVLVKGDTRPEEDETFLVRLSQSGIAHLPPRAAVGRITNDDGAR